MKHIVAIIVLVLIVIGIVIGCNACTSFNDHTYTIEVADKERVNSGDSGKYLIYGRSDDGETLVFENTDALLRGKFNSSNVYAEIEIGKTYEVTVVGYRIPILSEYENIIAFEEVVN